MGRGTAKMLLGSEGALGAAVAAAMVAGVSGTEYCK